MLTRTLCIILLLAVLLPACEAPASQPLSTSSVAGRNPGTLTVFAAASLTEAFAELGERFEAGHPGAEVTFSFAGSQQLSQQLAQGAPADVFASANQEQMDAAIQDDRILEGSQVALAGNQLVVILPRENPGWVGQLQDLARPGLKIVLAAEEVPAGWYSLQFLDKAAQSENFGADFKEKVLENVVSYEETVRAVLSKLILGEADAGIVYTSDISSANADQVLRIPIPDPLNVTASYFIAPLNDSPQPALAEAFIDFALSAEGQEILVQYGFFPVR